MKKLSEALRVLRVNETLKRFGFANHLSSGDRRCIVVLEVGEDDAMEAHEVSPALQARLGADAVAGLLSLLDATRREWTDDVTALALERFERRLTEEMAGVRVSMAQCEAGLRLEMGKLREELRKEMADLRFDLLKWSFAFWIGQVLAIAGILGLMLRLMR